MTEENASSDATGSACRDFADEISKAIKTVRNIRNMIERTKDDILAANVRFGEIPDLYESDRVSQFSAAITGLHDVINALELASKNGETLDEARRRKAVAEADLAEFELSQMRPEDAPVFTNLHIGIPYELKPGTDPEAEALEKFRKLDERRGRYTVRQADRAIDIEGTPSFIADVRAMLEIE